jgi:hypothetical protein
LGEQKADELLRERLPLPPTDAIKSGPRASFVVEVLLMPMVVADWVSLAFLLLLTKLPREVELANGAVAVAIWERKKKTKTVKTKKIIY